MKVDSSNLVDYSLRIGERVLAGRTQKQRKRSGQFLTPARVARFMAHQLGPIGDGVRVLDPAIGSGALICAIIERAIAAGHPTEFWVGGYEVDSELCQVARDVLKKATEIAASQGVTIHTKVHKRDFVLDSVSAFQSRLPLSGESAASEEDLPFTHIIANPPYFKLKKSDPRAQAMVDKVKGYTNIYTLFVALSVKRLLPGGRACFIIPRSFCSGAYFSAFRRELIEQVAPLYIHLFESRERVFKGSSVLQENVIFAFRKRHQDESPLSQPYVNISTSRDIFDLGNSAANRRVAMKRFIGERFGTFFFRLPTSELDEQILDTVDNWSGSLAQYGLDVSTGPVVAFRAKDYLADLESVEHGQAIPLLWMHNVNPYRVVWPASNGNKPLGIFLTARDEGLLVPRANYVLLRRFSAKEEPRRLISAPLLARQYKHSWVGLENHLNYVYSKQGKLQAEDALGLAALFNSALIDRYFRIINGNTQVNATELRALPLPRLEVIQCIGEKVKAIQSEVSKEANAIVFRTLYEHNCLSESVPIIEETRFEMGKI